MLTIDHLMWGAPDLDAGIAEAERLFGVTAAAGGSHPGLGTRNALLGFENGSYFEIIAPDPAQPLEGNFGAALAALRQPALVTFAVAAADLAALAGQARAAGCTPRGPIDTQRATPAGALLAWQLLFLRNHAFGGLCPFFIDWLDTPHPSLSAPQAGRLEALAIDTPAAPALGALLRALEVRVPVTQAAAPSLSARIRTGQGVVTLRSSAESVRLRFGS
ncbi:MAG: VOC family protein [Pseudomonadales bacterium]